MEIRESERETRAGEERDLDGESGGLERWNERVEKRSGFGEVLSDDVEVEVVVGGRGLRECE